MNPDLEIVDVMEAEMIRLWRLRLLSQTLESDLASCDMSESAPSPDFSEAPDAGVGARFNRRKSAFASKDSADREILPHKRPPPWLIGFSRQFQKETGELDRKLLGRVLIALEEVSTYPVPLKPHGDTFKPLGGQMSGRWRYRIGDHRLILEPDVLLAQINVLNLEARGSVYD